MTGSRLTYSGVFGPIRELFAQVPRRARAARPGRFSFNAPFGPACQGPARGVTSACSARKTRTRWRLVLVADTHVRIQYRTVLQHGNCVRNEQLVPALFLLS
jgi:hypothetical protein